MSTMKAEKREKPGRKPVKDRAKPITIYVKQSSIDRKGGKKKCRELLLEQIRWW